MNSKNFNSPIQIMDSRETIVEHIKSTKKTITGKSSVMESYKKENQDVRLLTYNILLEKFNDKYNGLNPKQKSLLKEYINNVNNTGKLKTFIDKNIDTIVKNLNKTLKFVDDKVVVVKLNEVSDQLIRKSDFDILGA